jgi:RND family efflux transporter MFP subunit
MMAAAVVLLVSACGHETGPVPGPVAGGPQDGTAVTVTAADRMSVLRVAGTAEPVQQATLSTKLMGTVVSVEVREGDRVRAGQPLLRIDARDLGAKAAQLEAALAEAEAAHAEAELHARRMRALYADEAAPRAQLDAAETGLARASAGVAAVRAGALELAATREYAVVRAPFDGVIVSRMADPGSFAAPGAPLLIIHDDSSLRVRATAAPEVARGLTRGQHVGAEIEGMPVAAVVEGVVPAAGGSVHTVNAIVANPGGALLTRGTAVLMLPLGMRSTLVIPRTALVRQGELTGVHLQRNDVSLLRWVRTGAADADSVEIVSGLSDGDVILIPARR